MLSSIYTLLSRVESQKNLKREQQAPIENLVLEGGGVKGLVYAGALRVFEEQGLLEKVKRIAGSSAGGIVSLLLCTGYTPAEIEKIMSEEINFKDLMDSRNTVDPTRIFSAAGMPIGASDIYLLFHNKGLYKGEKFFELAKALVKRKLESQLKEVLGDEYPNILKKYYITDLSLVTFEQLKQLNHDYPALKFKELYLTGTRIRDGKLSVFSADTTPQMPIVFATRITMSFPFGFEPVMYEGELYMDGGVADNYPMSIFDNERFLSHGRNEANVNPCTLGLLVDSKEEIEQRWGVKSKDAKEKLKLPAFLKGVIGALEKRSEVLKQFYSINSLQIFDEDVETMDLRLDAAKIQKLILSGKKAMQEYIDNYIGEEVLAHNLPDYKDFKEKIYSKKPPELMIALENEIFPLIKELAMLNKQIEDLDIEKTLVNINKTLAAIDGKTLSVQEDLYKELERISLECEKIETQLMHLNRAAEQIETRKSILLQRINSLEENHESSELESHYEEISNYSSELRGLKLMVNNLKEQQSHQKERVEILKQHIDKPLYELINQRNILESIQKNNLNQSLANAEEMLHEYADEYISVLHAQGIHYPDPRNTPIFAQHLFKLRQKNKVEVENYYKEQHYSEEESKKMADVYDAIFEDILNFGFSINQAQVYAHYYISSKSFFKEQDEELRQRFFKMLLVDKLAELNIVNKNDEEVLEWFKNSWTNALLRILENNKEVSRGYAEYLAKEEVLRKWEDLNQKSIKEEPFNLNYEYTISLQNEIKKLSEGKWVGSITFENQRDLAHNARREKNKQKGGQKGSSYLVNTFIYEANETHDYLAIDKKYQLPPIKMQLLRPEFIKENKPYEIILAFEQPSIEKKESQFALISKFSKKREAQFAIHKEAILEQLRIAVSQIKKATRDPASKITITIIGEGLAGQDAQYLFAELIKTLNENQENEILNELTGIDLKLIDPSRVSNKLNEKNNENIEALKKKRNIVLTGYNLIQQKTYFGIAKRRKPRNYIGESNILSGLSSENMEIQAEFRDLHQGNILYRKINNENGEKLDKALNKTNLSYSSVVYRKMSSIFKELKVFSQGLFLGFFPFTLKILKSLSLRAGYDLIRRTSSPLYRLYRLFKKPKTSLMTAVDWQIFSPLASSQKEDKNESFDTKMRKVLKRADPAERLTDDERPPLENLVFSGGMGKGIVYTSALHQMQAKGMLDHVKRVGGGSEGGLILALYAIGFAPEELIGLMMNEFNSKDLEDAPFTLGGLDKMFSLQGVDLNLLTLISSLKDKGLYKGEVLEKLMENCIRAKLEQKIKIMLYEKLSKEELARLDLPPYLSKEDKNAKIEAYLQTKLATFKETYRISDFAKITLGQLKMLSENYPQLKLKDIYLTGTRLQDAQLKVFSFESEPNIPLVKALKITCAIPGKYIPEHYEEDYFVSGNIANDYPIEIFDKTEFLTHGLNDAGVNPCSFGLMINDEAYRARWGLAPTTKSKFSLGKLVEGVFKAMYVKSHIVLGKYDANTIIFPEKLEKENALKKLFVGKKFNKKQIEILLKLGKDMIEQYDAHYRGDTLIYAKKHYQNLKQKYYAKNPLELKRILEHEILPLEEEFIFLITKIDSQKADLVREMHSLEIVLEGNDSLERKVMKYNALLHENKHLEAQLEDSLISGKKMTNLSKQTETLRTEIQNVALQLAEYDPIILGKVKRKLELEELIQLIDLTTNAKLALEDEKKIILSALEAKGVKFNKTSQRPVAPLFIKEKEPPSVFQAPKLTIDKDKLLAKTTMQKIMENVFLETEWEYQVEGEKHTFADKKNAVNAIQIEETRSKIHFSGTPVKKVIEAAYTYKNAAKKTSPNLNYGIEADSLEAAYALLSDLATSDFVIEEIKSIKIKNSSMVVEPQKVVLQVREDLKRFPRKSLVAKTSHTSF